MTPATPELIVQLRQPDPIPLDVELRCAGGQMLALVGPSGSGKATVLRALAGLFKPKYGVIRCGGETWLDSAAGVFVPARRRRVGYVPQHFALFPHLSVLQNVMAGLLHCPAPAREAAARDLLERVNLGGLEARKPNQLSGGQQQRVAVARALAREPLVLLLDEPFSTVDRATRERLYGELAALKLNLAMPTVMVTHDLHEAMLLADRLSVLHHGKTLQTGKPLDVVSHPDSVDVARLVGIRNIYWGGVLSHEAHPAVTLLRFGKAVLETPHRPELPPGSRVQWVIPSDGVILHRRDRPSHGEHENPLHGMVHAAHTLGEITRVALRPDADAQALLWFDIPSHVARRNGITLGVSASVSLRAAEIHVIPEVYL